uniref:Uncharacterized protein n=1 Tax=Glossina austeni TaxID=7395 RepID=A0A1A9VRT2_GLOAU
MENRLNASPLKNVVDLVQINKKKLQSILEKLNWSEAEILRNFNTNSQVEIKCKTIKNPRTSTFPESDRWKNSLNLHTSQLQGLLKNSKVEAPRNFAELQLNFTREEKLKIYEHIIENTSKVEEIVTAKRNRNEISFAEIVAAKRREKRKKRRYRTSKPTHTEEVRALLNLQMQALRQYLRQRKCEHTDRESQARGKSQKEEEGVSKSTIRECDEKTKDGQRSNKRKKLSKRSERLENGMPERSKRRSKDQYYRSSSRVYKRSPRKSRSRSKSTEKLHKRNRNRRPSSTDERTYFKKNRSQPGQQKDHYKNTHRK